MGFFSKLFGRKKKDEADVSQESQLEQQSLSRDEQDDQPVVDAIVKEEKAEQGHLSLQDDNESVFADGDKDSDLNSEIIDDIAAQVEEAEKKSHLATAPSRERALSLRMMQPMRLLQLLQVKRLTT